MYRPCVDRISQHDLTPGGCLLWGGVCSWGCLLQGGLLPGGCLLLGGVCSRGDRGCLLQGGVVVVSQHALRQTPSCEQNYPCLWKHNLAPTSLRAVITAPLGYNSKCIEKKRRQVSALVIERITPHTRKFTDSVWFCAERHLSPSSVSLHT